MMRRLLSRYFGAFILAGLLASVLCGCGGGGSVSTADRSTTTVTGDNTGGTVTDDLDRPPAPPVSDDSGSGDMDLPPAPPEMGH